jgi:hypothetical protein
MPFGIGGGKKRVIIRRYKAITDGGARKQYEADANKLAQQGYRPTSSVDHHGRKWGGVNIIVTYELVESAPRQAAPPPKVGRCAVVTPDGWQCALPGGHAGPHSTT